MIVVFRIFTCSIVFVTALFFASNSNAGVVKRQFDGYDALMAMDAPAWKFEEKLLIKFKRVKAYVVLRTRINSKKFSRKVISEPLDVSSDELRSSVPVTVMIVNNMLILRLFDDVSRKELASEITEKFSFCDKYGTGLTIDGQQVLMAEYLGSDETGKMSDMTRYIAVELVFE